MSTTLVVALSLAALVAVVALVTRRRAVDPLARAARGAPREKEEAALAVRTLWKLARTTGDVLPEVVAELRAGREADAIARLRRAGGVELADAQRVIDALAEDLARDGPLTRLLDASAPPRRGEPT